MLWLLRRRIEPQEVNSVHLNRIIQHWANWMNQYRRYVAVNCCRYRNVMIHLRIVSRWSVPFPPADTLAVRHVVQALAAIDIYKPLDPAPLAIWFVRMHSPMYFVKHASQSLCYTLLLVWLGLDRQSHVNYVEKRWKSRKGEMWRQKRFEMAICFFFFIGKEEQQNCIEWNWRKCYLKFNGFGELLLELCFIFNSFRSIDAVMYGRARIAVMCIYCVVVHKSTFNLELWCVKLRANCIHLFSLSLHFCLQIDVSRDRKMHRERERERHTHTYLISTSNAQCTRLHTGIGNGNMHPACACVCLCARLRARVCNTAIERMKWKSINKIYMFRSNKWTYYWHRIVLNRIVRILLVKWNHIGNRPLHKQFLQMK